MMLNIAFGREARTQLGELAKPNKGLSGGKAGGANVAKGKKKSRRVNNRGGKGAIDPFEKAGPDKHNSLFHGRYVDAEYNPITADDVRKALATDAKDLPDKYLELVVARRVPVRVAFRMDERKIPDFISTASKSPFAFEVYQVRINKHVPGEGIVMVGALKNVGTGDGGRGGQEESDRNIGAAGGGAGLVDEDPGQQASADLSDLPVELRVNYDVDVEFYGVVKIYNPVDEALLRGEKKGGSAKPAAADAKDAAP